MRLAGSSPSKNPDFSIPESHKKELDRRHERHVQSKCELLTRTIEGMKRKGEREMTKLLKKAFEEASKLPNIEQNALAKRLLEELEAEKKWDQLFSESEDLLEKLADEAREEIRQGKTKPMDIDAL